MKVKEESEKDGLKLNIQKTKIMASSPMTSWEIDGDIKEALNRTPGSIMAPVRNTLPRSGALGALSR